MRRPLLLTFGALLFVGGCAALNPAEPPPPKPAVARDWVLVTPPDNPAVMHIVNGMHRLPVNGSAFPAANGALNDADHGASRKLFDEVKRLATPQDKAAMLVRDAVLADAAVRDWRKVRQFKSRELCEERRAALQDATRVQRDKIKYYPDTMMDELTFLFLARSFDHSRCIPVDPPAAARQG